MFGYIVLSAMLGSVAFAQVQLHPVVGTVAPGSTVTFSWQGNTGPVTLKLRKGDPAHLGPPTTITTGASGSSFAWHVPSDFSAASGSDYAVEIDSGSETNYISGVTVDNPSAKPESSSSSTTSSHTTSTHTTSTHTTPTTKALVPGSTETGANDLATNADELATDVGNETTESGVEETATDITTSTSTDESTGVSTDTSTEKSSETSTSTESAPPTSLPTGDAACVRAAVPVALLGAVAAVFAL